MDALQEAGIRLHEHVARCQIRHRGIKLDNPIPFSLRTVTGEAIVLIELFASREIALTRGGVGCRSHEPTGRRQHAKDREAGTFHDIPFLFGLASTPLTTAFRRVPNTFPKPRGHLIEQRRDRSIGSQHAAIGILARCKLYRLKSLHSYNDRLFEIH